MQKPPRACSAAWSDAAAAPFVLHLADGRRIPVRERFFMMLPPGSRTIRVAVTDGTSDAIDAELVTDLKFKRAARKRRRTA